MECDIFPSVLWHCWLSDRKGIRPVKNWVLVCWWWRFDWSFARLIAPTVTTTSIIRCFNKHRLKPRFTWKMADKMRERERDRQTDRDRQTEIDRQREGDGERDSLYLDVSSLYLNPDITNAWWLNFPRNPTDISSMNSTTTDQHFSLRLEVQHPTNTVKPLVHF